MEIYINKKRAALKKGTSFEYVAENRLFSGSDSYTFSITFPLRGCKQNLDIFGHINRMDVITGKVIFDCEIRDRNFYKFGSVTITEINDSEVKVQFLEGRSEQNFDDTLEDIFINELDLGSGKGCDDSTPENAWNPFSNDFKCVALPWVNAASGNIQNLADFIVDDTVPGKGHSQWNEECKGRSWQPYLLYIVKKILDAIGYTYDLSAWEKKEEYKYLLVCNTLPHAWDINDFASALPHWSVKEFFEKLELFLNVEFDFDHKGKHVAFAFTEDVVSSLRPVALDKIVDEHSVDIDVEEDKCEYREAKNLQYKECTHDMWKFYSCDWFIKAIRNSRDSLVCYDTLNELLDDNYISSQWDGFNNRGSNINKVLYAADVDMYFVIRSLSKTLVRKNESPRTNIYRYRMELRPVNLFGGRIIDPDEDADYLEVEFVPVQVDETDEEYGRLMFLSFSGYDDNTTVETYYDRTNMDERKKYIDEYLFQPQAVQTLCAGEEKKRAEFYNCIYMAWWDGASHLPYNGKLPHPYAENIEIEPDWSDYRLLHFSLRLNSLSAVRSSGLHSIDTRKKWNFQFLSDDIPNPRAVFFIKGKRYLCEKLTATFTENGMSQLIKGEFFPLSD